MSSLIIEAKQQLIDIIGLSANDKADLLTGDEYGLQGCMLDAIAHGDKTLSTLFFTNDPTVTVTSGRFIQPNDDRDFDFELATAKDVIQMRREEQRVLPTSYNERYGGSSVDTSEVATTKAEIAAMKGENLSVTLGFDLRLCRSSSISICSQAPNNCDP